MKTRRGFTLLECVIVLTIAIVLGVFLVRSMFVARERAVVGQLAESGARSKLEENRSVRMLDLSRLPTDKIDMSQILLLPNLKSLNLDHTQTTDAHIAELANGLELEQIHLVGTAISDAAARSLASWKGLRYLDLRATLLSDQALEELASLKNLVELRLSQTMITNAGLKLFNGHENLRVLDLRFTHFDDDGIDNLLTLSKLQEVRLTGSRITSAGLNRLRAARPQIKMSWEPDSNSWHSYRILLVAPRGAKPPSGFVTRETPTSDLDIIEQPVIARLLAAHGTVKLMNGRVSDVSFGHTEILTDAILSDLHLLRNLQTFNVEYVEHVTGVRLDCLKHCWNLRDVKFVFTELEDEGLRSIALARSLRVLYIQGNRKITDDARSAFGQARALEVMSLQETQITDRGLELFAEHTETTNFHYLNVTKTDVTPKGLLTFRSRFKNGRIDADPEVLKEFNKLQSAAQRK